MDQPDDSPDPRFRWLNQLHQLFGRMGLSHYERHPHQLFEERTEEEHSRRLSAAEAKRERRRQRNLQQLSRQS